MKRNFKVLVICMLIMLMSSNIAMAETLLGSEDEIKSFISEQVMNELYPSEITFNTNFENYKIIDNILNDILIENNSVAKKVYEFKYEANVLGKDNYTIIIRPIYNMKDYEPFTTIREAIKKAETEVVIRNITEKEKDFILNNLYLFISENEPYNGYVRRYTLSYNTTSKNINLKIKMTYSINKEQMIYEINRSEEFINQFIKF